MSTDFQNPRASARGAVKRNHTGHRVGESHHRAKLSDEKVREMRHDHEKNGMTWKQLAYKYNTSYWTVRDIVSYITRRSA